MSHLLRIIQGDCLEKLFNLPQDSVDLVVTDPAYASLERHRAKGTTTRLTESDGSSNKWFPVIENDRFPLLFAGLYRVLKPMRHAYVMCDEETSDVVKVCAAQAGFYVWKSLVWVKTGSTTDPVDGETDVAIGMGYHYRNSTERIVFLEKRSTWSGPTAWSRWPMPSREPLPMFGDRVSTDDPPRQGSALPLRTDPAGKGRQLHDLSIPDVLFAPRVRNGYPTEKPVELAELLIRQSTELGELVLDPFGGSGWAGLAAVQQGRRAILIDVHQPAIDTMRARLAPWRPT